MGAVELFENPEANGPGIISFITAASYLRGPGFVGMRQKMREAFDELWIIDLEGDNFGARKTENVFNIQIPVAIAIGVRYGRPSLETPAHVRYTRLTGTREEKFEKLNAINSFADLQWQDCFDGWMRPFLPVGRGDYFAWPLLTDLFPWQHSGVQFKRTWPIGESPEVLQRRWRELLRFEGESRRRAFRESRDRKVDVGYVPLRGGSRLPKIASLRGNAAVPEIVRYGFRSFDRQHALLDARVGDFLRPVFWKAHSDRQVYLTSLLTDVLGLGPAATVSSEPPDLHHFRGRGGKDVIPFWRDAEHAQVNITEGLLRAISEEVGSVTAEDLFGYCYAVLATPAYVETFSEELTIPGPRIPITKDPQVFERAVVLGRRLVWLHTYGERFSRNGQRRDRVPQGTARSCRGIPGRAGGYPESFSYDEGTQTLRIGEGVFAPVSKLVWEFSVSGLEVVKSWLNYRMLNGAGRSSSPLV
jgi:hypothetical protein